MSSIQEILASILNAVYGKDVRQAIHDGVEMAYNKADDAATSAAAAAEAASGSQESAAASAQAASNSASSASDFADAAEQYKNEAFHTTPAGYEDFVNQVNSSLEKNGYGAHGIKNLVEQVWYYTQTQQYKTIAEATYYVENGKTYTISFDTPNTGVQCYIQGDSVSGLQTTSAFYLDGTRKTITAICVATGQHTKAPFIAIRSNTGVASGMLSNLQIEEGSTATEYNPFAQSNVALTSKLAYKEIPITFETTNLFDTSSAQLTAQIRAFKVGANYILRFNGKFNALATSTYTHIGTISEWTSDVSSYVMIPPTDGSGKNILVEVRNDGKIYIEAKSQGIAALTYYGQVIGI